MLTKDIKDWYAAHGLPNPEDGNAVLAARIKTEAVRKGKQEDALWDIVGQHTRVRETLEVLPTDEFHAVTDAIVAMPQKISNPEDIKIGFK